MCRKVWRLESTLVSYAKRSSRRHRLSLASTGRTSRCARTDAKAMRNRNIRNFRTMNFSKVRHASQNGCGGWRWETGARGYVRELHSTRLYRCTDSDAREQRTGASAERTICQMSSGAASLSMHLNFVPGCSQHSSTLLCSPSSTAMDHQQRDR